MDHLTFGKVVASLRKEQTNFRNGQNWSQQDLANESGLTPRIVGRIERGEQARLDGGVLGTLAKAFNLTSLERREFFAMASEVTGQEIVREDLCDNEVFTEVWELLNGLCAPAFLTNPFSDIVGVNRSLLLFHGINIQVLQAFRSTAVGVNNLGLLFEPNTPLKQVLGYGWRSIAHANVQQWRVATLRYRHTDRFRQLFTALSAFTDFRMMWAAGNDAEYAIEDCSRLRSCIYKHGVHGSVAYTVFVNISLSASGDLYLCTFVPHNSDTATLFQKLAGDDNGAVHISQWPNPKLMLA
ncbi:MAG: helix-turn-helix domain-containing protein [Caldilineaceae bacterium]|nr:helix-turn-helix domain-containing protein [Caldilineaceae bacterium]